MRARTCTVQAIETECGVARRDMDLPDEQVEYILDIAEFVQSTWLSQQDHNVTA